MRTVFISEVAKLMRNDERIVFLMAECGFNVVEELQAEFPSRFFNTGIAEQSLVSVAAGIALRGLKPIAYTMSSFLSMRAFEQIRIDVAYQNLPVILAGVIPGLGYGNSGPTHYAIEDTALMRVLPNMTVVYPGNEVDVRACARQVMSLNAPCYIGLARAPAHFSTPYSDSCFQIGRAIQITEGRHAALFTYGAMLPVTLKAAEQLQKKGILARVYNIHTIKPLDTAAIAEAAVECGVVFSVEEESIIGGLGGAIAEFLAEDFTYPCVFKRIGIPDTYGNTTGTQRWLQRQFCIDAPSIVSAVEGVLTH